MLCALSAVLVASTGLFAPGACTAATIVKASTSRDDRVEAMREIPYDQLTAEARERIKKVVDSPSMFRRMPVNVVDCDPKMYRFLVRYPEVVVNIWQLMGITKVDTTRVGPFLINASDGVGTVTNIELVYGSQDTHVLYCEGHYEGPLFRKPLTGRCVLLLRSGYQQTEQQDWQITSRMDVFLQVDNMAVDAVTRTLHPLLGKSADLNFVQSTEFLERISTTTEENGPGMRRLAERLDKVQPEIRQEFAELAAEIHEQAQARMASQVVRGQNIDARK
jgi:hypothetical protein